MRACQKFDLKVEGKLWMFTAKQLSNWKYGYLVLRVFPHEVDCRSSKVARTIPESIKGVFTVFLFAVSKMCQNHSWRNQTEMQTKTY